ncbi:MAG: hypothetical protein E3J72_13935 [Planctomycetota bacterium]|nr:MAG: hypothetical protein E3J72_13935 [Planctomycetota bacterium]
MVGARGWGAVLCVRATHRVAPTIQPTGPTRGSIGAIIGQFKSIVTKRINKLHRKKGSSIWQRSYYDHVIRDEDELNRIRQYIIDNPVNWAIDRENPDVKKKKSDGEIWET